MILAINGTMYSLKNKPRTDKIRVSNDPCTKTVSFYRRKSYCISERAPSMGKFIHIVFSIRVIHTLNLLSLVMIVGRLRISAFAVSYRYIRHKKGT